MCPTVFVNIHRTSHGLEAHDGVWTGRADAVDAAEQYASSYQYTLTDAGRIDLTPDFSEEYTAARDAEAAREQKTDAMREARP
jgi:hypothetical protein